MNALGRVKVSRHFDATPERVFDAWLDKTTAGRWLFATPTGEMVRVDIDPRIGGKYLFVDRRDGIDVEHFGEYRELNRPTRLVFTFAVSGYEANAVTVAVDIERSATGAELTLSHDVLEEFRERTKQGWAMILDNLAKTLA
jgi:uncharacterized protein YndB with AHSA1/START domain